MINFQVKPSCCWFLSCNNTPSHVLFYSCIFANQQYISHNCTRLYVQFHWLISMSLYSPGWNEMIFLFHLSRQCFRTWRHTREYKSDDLLIVSRECPGDRRDAWPPPAACPGHDLYGASVSWERGPRVHSEGAAWGKILTMSLRAVHIDFAISVHDATICFRMVFGWKIPCCTFIKWISIKIRWCGGSERAAITPWCLPVWAKRVLTLERWT